MNMGTAPQSFVSCLFKMHINGFGGLNEMSASREAKERPNTETRAMPRARYPAQQLVNAKYEENKMTNKVTF